MMIVSFPSPSLPFPTSFTNLIEPIDLKPDWLKVRFSCEDGSSHNSQGRSEGIFELLCLMTFYDDREKEYYWRHHTHTTTVYSIQNSQNKSLEAPLALPFLYVLCCTYVFLFMSLFCLKNKLCGFIQCLFRICRDVGNRKLIRFELRFSMRGIG